MTSKKFVVSNVLEFNGYSVEDGEVTLTDSEYEEFLNDSYGDVDVCGGAYSAGDVLKMVDPIAFSCGKSDFESSIQSDLEDQLDREDDTGILFHDDEECIYYENGYGSREEYLKSLSEEYEIPLNIVINLANLLGEDEDFDGLVVALEDYEHTEE